ncbi:MAG: hypothetical protein M3Z04_24215 [Chloroflexota bacterium]|nr:hypothetical protein [Chloroflexota bacterium]
MNRKARRRRRHRGLLPRGSRWAALTRGLRRQARSGLRTARGRRNELAITALYALAGALCLALAALLLVGPGPATALSPNLADHAATPATGLRAALIGVVLVGGLGVILLGVALARLRAWWTARQR